VPGRNLRQLLPAHMTIGVASPEIMDEVTRTDRHEIERIMFVEVLEKTRYPTVQFKSSHVTAAKTAENMF
jgi:hypothetical protein